MCQQDICIEACAYIFAGDVAINNRKRVSSMGSVAFIFDFRIKAKIIITFQQAIFNGKGCASGGCHSGNRPAGNMNLSSGSSFTNTVGRPAASSPLQRIQPGNANNSYLFRKVSAKTNPGSFSISGSPMPLGGNALSDSQLAALAAWINAGAPQTGRSSESNEVEVLLGACT